MASPHIPLYHDLNVTFTTSNLSGTATVHYVEAGNPTLPTLLLLHGFPSSSYEFRDLIPMLFETYHVLAPDYPGFGLTKAPSNFVYTFANIATAIAAWLAALNVTETAMYIHDFGAPVGLRLAITNATKPLAIISQNANLYDAGFGQDFWAPVFTLWNTSDSESARNFLADNFLTPDGTKAQYTTGTPQDDVELLYPEFQNFIKDSKVPILAVWGKGDPAFIPARAEAFLQDSPNAVIEFVDAGHFALETKRWEIARFMKQFLTQNGY